MEVIAMEIVLVSKSAIETMKIAETISHELKVGDVISLDGDLGAGKTTFTQGLGKGLGVSEQINSPTFNILKCYFSGRMPLYHIDAYRLEDRVNSDIGLEEVIQGDGVAIIEWSKFIKDYVFEPLEINIEIVSDNVRKITLSTKEDKYDNVFKKLEDFLNE